MREEGHSRNNIKKMEIKMGACLKNMLTHRQRVRTWGKGEHTQGEMETRRVRTLSSASGASVDMSSRSHLSTRLGPLGLGAWAPQCASGRPASSC